MGKRPEVGSTARARRARWSGIGLCMTAAVLVSGCGSLVTGTVLRSTAKASSHQSASGSSGGGSTTASAGTPSGETTTSAAGSGPGAAGTGAAAAGTGSGSAAGGSGTPGATSASHDAGSTGPPGGTPGASSAAAPGGPIKIGFLLTETSNVKSFGLSMGNTVSEQQVDQALVDAINKQGGLSGHQIDPVFATTDTGDASWDADFAAACATFTQDNHVMAVLGYEFTFDTGFENCLAQAGIPHLVTGFNIPDPSTLAAYPDFWALDVPNIDARSLAKVEGAVATGYLTSADKIGVVTDACPGTQPAWTNVVEPYLKEHDLTVASSFEIDCGTGDNASESAEISELPNLVLQFKTAGVDRVMFISVSEAPELYGFADTAETQNYSPGYIVSSLAQLSILTGQLTSSQLQNVHGFGWLPSQDVSPSQYGAPNASQAKCLSDLRSQGIVPSAAADYGYAYNVCEAVFVYQDALGTDGGSTTGTAVSAAIARLGTSFVSTTDLNGSSVFSTAKQNDAPAVYRPIDWETACSCFEYTGSAYPMP